MDEIINLFTQHGSTPFLNYTQAAVVLIDPRGKLLEGNPAFERSRAALPQAEYLQELLNPASLPTLAEMLSAGAPRQARLQMQPGVGHFDFECLLTPLPDGNFLFFAEQALKPREAEVTRLMEELQKTRRALKIKKIDLESVLVQANEISHTDALTFLANRKQIVADLQREVIACERYKKSMTIFMADLDHFKLVNDTYGHAAGDQTLRAVSNEMMMGIRKIDKLGRYGGEEFLFILPNTRIKSAIKVADRILNVVRKLPVKIDEQQTIHISISIGIAQYRVGKENWEEVLRRADRALYRSKESGRDQWTIANDEDCGTISSRAPQTE